MTSNEEKPQTAPAADIAEQPKESPPKEQIPKEEPATKQEKAAAPPDAPKTDVPPATTHKPTGAAPPASNGTAAAAPSAIATPASPRTLPVRPYLEKTVVPLLMQGMQQLSKDRPEDPVGWLADYLQQHNPKRQRNN